MKVLILSCNTGEGHNSCAAALEEECRNKNIPCDTEDALRFISPEVSRFISNWHVRIYRHAPGLFRVGYRAAEDHPAQFHEGSALYRYLTQGAEKLCGFIAGSGYDTVICTHTFAALMVSEVVKTHLPNLKTCFIATDYTCSPSGNAKGALGVLLAHAGAEHLAHGDAAGTQAFARHAAAEESARER